MKLYKSQSITQLVIDIYKTMCTKLWVACDGLFRVAINTRDLDFIKTITYDHVPSKYTQVDAIVLTYDEHTHIAEWITDYYDITFYNICNTHDDSNNDVLIWHHNYITTKAMKKMFNN
jgi:hypothetical protein